MKSSRIIAKRHLYMEIKFINSVHFIDFNTTEHTQSTPQIFLSQNQSELIFLPDLTHFTASSIEQNVGSLFNGWPGSGEYV